MNTFESLDWSGEANPRSLRYDDIYYDKDNGKTESLHVFVKQNKIMERVKSKLEIMIGELGFGTGLNFFTTLEALELSGAHLHFVSIEKNPLSPEDCERAIAQWPELMPWVKKLIPLYKKLEPGKNTFTLDHHTLELWIGEVGDFLKQFPQNVDAWYLDGFNPKKNPEMWTEEIFKTLYEHSSEGTTFSTFTVAGNVKRAALTAGFTLEKVAGFGKKREILRGIYNSKAHADLPNK